MSDQYMKELLRVAVAQICQTIGYNATQTAPLELLQDVLDKFLREFTRDLRRQVEHYNRTEANLNDVTLTLDSINVNLNELLDYINNVEPVPFAIEVPKFPARKDSYLNFLKPGSKEVLTRPVHVHDHLPPMLPPEITQPPETPLPSTSNGLSDMKPFPDNLASAGTNNNSTTGENDPSSNKSLNPSAVLDKTTLQSLFKPSSNLEDGERPTREVSSVVMTTGGYISPAVEGKMPEAIVPDIIDKLLGLDAPPPPPPPPPSRPPSRSATSTPIPPATDVAVPSTIIKDIQPENQPLKDIPPATLKESKKALAKILDSAFPNKKTDIHKELSTKKEKLFKAAKAGYPHEAHLQQTGGSYNKKSFMMHQNAAGMHTSQTNYANMLLKKAKKQKVPNIPGQAMNEKHTGKQMAGDKIGKLDAADKAHRKYMKMLQKMAKQGKIPPELLSNIMGPDKKSKMINPAIVASMPPGPEKLQLEKLLRKQAKQRQKIIKQQMMSEAKKPSKKSLQLPPLVPIFPLGPPNLSAVNKPLHVDLDEQKHKMEQQKAILNVSPVKPPFIPNIITPPGAANHLPETLLSKNMKPPIITETPPLEIMETPKMLTGVDGKELKLSSEPDRTKLNIFKKISKQKTPKSSSPIPMRIPGLGGDAPIINLPSGTTITPTPGPLTSTAVGRNLFPPLPEASNVANSIINKDKPLPSNVNPNQPTDLTMFNRVFGEKPNDAELVNKPKKRGRKPGSKNSPKIPGVFPNNLLKKGNKKLKMDNALFGPQMQIPPEFAAAVATGGNLTLDNVAQLFGNPMEWAAQQKQLQQQMMIMATAKERKEHKKKNKLLKQDILSNDNNMATMTMTNPSALGVPTSEEVQSINKKLMRMDTILKPAPSSLSQPNDLSIDTSLITGKKLPSPSMFPASNSPLKSPGNSKRLLADVNAAMAASLAQPYMLPNRPSFPNLPSNMLSMLQFPFPTRPGLIPGPGLFPTPGLGGFPNNPKNHLLPGLFPFPNFKQPMSDNLKNTNQESEDLTTDKKKSDINLQNIERSYCNVAPLVPEFLTKLNESANKHNEHHQFHQSEMDLPKTPKPRSSSHSNTISQDNLLKKMVDAHTPESMGSISNKSIPSTPGGMSLNTFEQLMKKNESPMDLLSLNKQSKAITTSQESCLDFSMNKKPNHPNQGLGIKTPITMNNDEPIEVSDDSDETNQQQPLSLTAPLKTQAKPNPAPPPPPATSVISTQLTTPQQNTQGAFNMDEMFVANTTKSIQKPMETDLSTKELKKLKKQVKKSSTNITTSLINTDKSEGGGVGKLAGGADLIPLASTGLAYSSKNIPFNSLTANANPSFNVHKTDFNSTSSTPASSSVFDNLTITAAIPTPSANTSSVFDLQKKRKEHKKLKKLKEIKEGKIKKKKDKKDKTKSKEKAEKYLSTQTSPVKEKEPPMVIDTVPPVVAISSSSGGSGSGGNIVIEKLKDKDLQKKLKKEKKKEKQRSTAEELPTHNISVAASTSISTAKDLITASSSTHMETEAKKQKSSPSLQNSTSSGNEQELATIATVSKVTPPTAASAVVPKLTLKLSSTQSPTPPPQEDILKIANIIPAAGLTLSPPRDNQREPSPELARISPLVTRPPKHKLNTSGELATSSASTTNSISAANASTLEMGNGSKTSSSTPNPNMIVPPPSPWLSGGTISASSVLLPHQLLQTTKQQHDLTTTPTSATHPTDPQKTTNTDRQSPLTLITETSRPSSYIDAEGNRVWICPACGKVDDGSPMIGCDGCDAWYHWVCVGIFVVPKDNEDWFCRVCITRKKGLHGSDKKRKRNKKK